MVLTHVNGEPVSVTPEEVPSFLGGPLRPLRNAGDRAPLAVSAELPEAPEVVRVLGTVALPNPSAEFEDGLTGEEWSPQAADNELVLQEY